MSPSTEAGTHPVVFSLLLLEVYTLRVRIVRISQDTMVFTALITHDIDAVG